MAAAVAVQAGGGEDVSMARAWMAAAGRAGLAGRAVGAAAPHSWARGPAWGLCGDGRAAEEDQGLGRQETELTQAGVRFGRAEQETKGLPGLTGLGKGR